MDTENKYGTLEMQRSLLVLLKYFHRFSEINSIKYSLAYGSLLGAVRHQGFIPWDDDLDIIVDRDNYTKIICAASSYDPLEIERVTSETLWVDRVRMSGGEDKGSYLPTIDIFVLDNIPENRIVASFKFLCIYMMQGMMKSKLSLRKGSFIMKLFSLMTWLLGCLFPIKTKYRWYQSISQWGNNKRVTEIACFNACFKDVHCRFTHNIMEEINMVPFESLIIPIMKGYDNFLTSRYGDYMTPPKEKDRIPQHIHN